MYVLSVPSVGRSRVGFVCGRHVGHAVVRNRARRVMREAWRELAPEVPGGFDIVLVAKPEIVPSKADDVRRELVSILRGARVIEA